MLATEVPRGLAQSNLLEGRFGARGPTGPAPSWSRWTSEARACSRGSPRIAPPSWRLGWPPRLARRQRRDRAGRLPFFVGRENPPLRARVGSRIDVPRVPVPRRYFLFVFALWLCAALAPPTARAAEPELLVFAAASLTNVLEALGPKYTEATGQPVKFSFAASSALARQLEAGAAADVFVSADVEWMDYAQTRGLIDRTTRRDLLGNRLVLIAPAASEDPARDRAGLPARQGAGPARPARDRRSGLRPGRQVRAPRIDEPGRVDRRRRSARARRQRAHRARVRGARRGAARNRLRHRREDRAGRARGRRVSGRYPPSDHLPGRGRARRALRCGPLRRVPERRRGAAGRSRSSVFSHSRTAPFREGARRSRAKARSGRSRPGPARAVRCGSSRRVFHRRDFRRRGFDRRALFRRAFDRRASRRARGGGPQGQARRAGRAAPELRGGPAEDHERRRPLVDRTPRGGPARRGALRAGLGPGADGRLPARLGRLGARGHQRAGSVERRLLPSRALRRRGRVLAGFQFPLPWRIRRQRHGGIGPSQRRLDQLHRHRAVRAPDRRVRPLGEPRRRDEPGGADVPGARDAVGSLALARRFRRAHRRRAAQQRAALDELARADDAHCRRRGGRRLAALVRRPSRVPGAHRQRLQRARRRERHLRDRFRRTPARR